jgi:hypothetical protein
MADRLRLAGALVAPHTHEETDIADGDVFPRLDAAETVLALWVFPSGGITIGAETLSSPTAGLLAVGGDLQVGGDDIHGSQGSAKRLSFPAAGDDLQLVGLNLALDAGATVDGVDLSAHAADGDAHHAQSHGSADHAGTIGKRFASLLWYVDGTVAVGDGQSATPYLEDSVDKIRIRAAVDTAPTGAAIIAEVNHSTDRSAWTVVGTVTIAAGATTGVTELSAGTLAAGWYRLDINQVGSTTAGADLTVIFVCKQPLAAS